MNKGFSLTELLLYVGILAIISSLFVGILLVVTRVNVTETASNEVSNQMNFVLQTIQRLVRESSNIEAALVDDNGDTPDTEEASYLKLRMAEELKDPTCVSLIDDGRIWLTEGNSLKPGRCAEPKSGDPITTDKVVIPTEKPVGLGFAKISNYPGHDIVQIDLIMNFNTTNPQSQFSKTLTTAVGRASAATFDSDLLPGAVPPNLIPSIGQDTRRWLNGYFAGNVEVDGDLKAGGVGRYFQFRTSGAEAPSGGCSSDADRGKLYLRTDSPNFRLYICNGQTRGWDYTNLNN